MDVQMRKGSGCLAICFHPGMAHRFFQVPMNVYTDTTTELADVWNSMASEIEDKVANACDNNVRVLIIQQYLVNQLCQNENDPQINWCLQRVHALADMPSVKQLTHETGLSQRHLSRRFQQCVGLSPKKYLSVSRFIRSLQRLKKYPAYSLTEVAYECGYYDQAHFIRDFKYYTGHTPGEVAGSGHILY
jgi:AraC-like DNA-binding protein